MNSVYRTIGILGLSLFMAGCSKGKTPDTTNANAATATSVSVDMLGRYDLNNVTQIQFETHETNSFRPAPTGQQVLSKILILVMNNSAVTNKGIYIKTGNGAECTGSVASFAASDLVLSLGEGRIGPNSHAAITPDSGFDRLTLFFKDGSSKVLPFDDRGAPLKTEVILEAADEPLRELLYHLYDSGDCRADF